MLQINSKIFKPRFVLGVGTLTGESLTETEHSNVNNFKTFFENLQKVLQLLNYKLDLKLLFFLLESCLTLDLIET